MITDLDTEALRQYFENRKDIAFAFLFGSGAKGIAFVVRKLMGWEFMGFKVFISHSVAPMELGIVYAMANEAAKKGRISVGH